MILRGRGSPPDSGPPRVRAVILRGVFGLGFLAGLELLSWLLLSVSARFGIVYRPIPRDRLLEEDRRAVERLLTDQTTYLAHSWNLGWTIRPLAASPDGMYRANSQGMRANRDYGAVPPAGLIRISAYGDSFVHGDEVPAEETWESELMRLDPRLEVLNFGVMGFGPDQAWLRYQWEGARFKSHIVLIGFMSENIQRVVNVFRAFYSPGAGMPFAKPRFLLEGSELRLLENPLPAREDYRGLLEQPRVVLEQLAKDDRWSKWMPHEGRWDGSGLVRLCKTMLFWYRRILSPNAILSADGVYRPGSESFDLSRRILSGFYSEVEMRGELPVIVLFPGPMDVVRYRESGKSRYAPLAEALRDMKLRVIDPMEALAGAAQEGAGGVINVHYTTAQNRIVARKILEELTHTWAKAMEKKG